MFHPVEHLSKQKAAQTVLTMIPIPNMLEGPWSFLKFVE